MLLASRCAGCGRSGSSPCPVCHRGLRPPAPEPDPPGLEGLVCLLRYDGPARPLVARIKYRNHRGALDWLAGGLAEAVSATGTGPGAVTWAPTTAAHRHERGFDHGELLARAVARRLELPVEGLLVRAAGAAQTGRPAWARRGHGPSFDCPRALSPATPVLVVDDVVTTGATLRAAVLALRRAGVPRVVAAAAARTPARQAAAPR